MPPSMESASNAIILMTFTEVFSDDRLSIENSLDEISELTCIVMPSKSILPAVTLKVMMCVTASTL